MNVIEDIKLYFRTRPDMAKRAMALAVVLAVVLPATYWFIWSSEEKAYILFTNGYYYYRNHSLSQAEGSLGQLTSLYPNSKFTPMGRYYMGLTYLSGNHLDEAAAQFRFFLDENKKHFLRPRVYALSMAVELSLGRPEVCVSLADKYLAEFGRDEPSVSEILYRKGVALLQAGKSDQASICFEEASKNYKDGSIFGNFAFFAKTSHEQM